MSSTIALLLETAIHKLRFWRYIKAKRKDQSGIPVLRANGKDITDPEEKANILNDHYESVFTTESPTLPNLDTRDIPDMPSIIIDIVTCKE